ACLVTYIGFHDKAGTLFKLSLHPNQPVIGNMRALRYRDGKDFGSKRKPMGSATGLTETVLYDTLVNYLISMARTVEGAMNRALEAIVSANDPKASALTGAVVLLEPRL